MFALAEERHVPILIHGGRGLPPIADGLANLVERHPGASLIIAHAGIADLANLTAKMAGRKNVFFDTSTWSVIDLLDLYHRIPPEQILYASDFPYGQQPGSLFIALRSAHHAGFDDAQLRAMLAGNANRLADGEELPEPTAPVGGGSIEQPLQLARIHVYLSQSVPFIWLRQPDTIGVLGLALNACAERNGNAETTTRIAELIATAAALWTRLPDTEDEADRFALFRTTARLVQLADVEALTGA